MLAIPDKAKIAFLCCFLLSTTALCPAGIQLDKSRYITIDEVKPGMKAYCLTSYKGTEIEKFDLEVLSVVRDVMPGRDAIMVQGTDERFIHTGPVAGCSGSPVYIEGRLAGAFSFGWAFSKDPLYGVTPIEEMLRIGGGHTYESGPDSFNTGGFSLDFSVPIDFEQSYEQITAPQRRRQDNTTFGYAANLPCPLITYGLPAELCEQMNKHLEPFGFMAVSGMSTGSSNRLDRKSGSVKKDVKLAPGATVAIPMITGDMKWEVIGTVTEVVDDHVYAFGHSFLGYGPIDLPMATSEVHTVVSSVYRSFKFASSLEIVGAFKNDQSTAVLGYIGQKAKMVPLTIKIDHYNVPQQQLYNCQLASNRLYTPLVFGYAVGGAVLSRGSLPPDHMLEYNVNIKLQDAEPVSFSNVSSHLGLQEIIRETVVSVVILMNNPYRRVNIESIDCDVRIVPKDIVSHIWSVNLSDSKLKAGQNLDVETVVESVLAGKKKYRCSLTIPQDIEPGQYNLIVCGGYEYFNFLRKNVPYRFTSQNLSTLIEVINNILAIRRDRLYYLLVLPPRGIAVEKAELPDLPATKALILQDAKRTLRSRPFLRWVEETTKTGTVVIDAKKMQITIEK
jgi:hypothetical protein